MHIFARILAVIFVVFVCPHAHACNFPDPVSIPDGNTATEREMAGAGRAVLKYFGQYEKYTACVESETSALRKSAVDSDISTNRLREELAASKINAASAAVEDLAARFNEATEKFESRSK